MSIINRPEFGRNYVLCSKMNAIFGRNFKMNSELPLFSITTSGRDLLIHVCTYKVDCKSIISKFYHTINVWKYEDGEWINMIPVNVIVYYHNGIDQSKSDELVFEKISEILRTY